MQRICEEIKRLGPRGSLVQNTGSSAIGVKKGPSLSVFVAWIMGFASGREKAKNKLGAMDIPSNKVEKQRDIMQEDKAHKMIKSTPMKDKLTSYQC
eukprot:7666303-Ditylum_brightwellii.AAC.1